MIYTSYSKVPPHLLGQPHPIIKFKLLLVFARNLVTQMLLVFQQHHHHHHSF